MTKTIEDNRSFVVISAYCSHVKQVAKKLKPAAVSGFLFFRASWLRRRVLHRGLLNQTRIPMPKVTIHTLRNFARAASTRFSHCVRLSHGGLRGPRRGRHDLRRRLGRDDDVGLPSTIGVTIDEMLVFARAVCAARRVRSSSAICRS